MVLASQREAMTRFPSAFGEALCALDFSLSTPLEIAIVGHPGRADTRALLNRLDARYLPNTVVLGRMPEDERLGALSPLMAGKAARNDQATVYVCRNYACQAPTSDPQAFAQQLAAAGV
jgi:uncharacterized protein YyaL (SSP411 family)